MASPVIKLPTSIIMVALTGCQTYGDQTAHPALLIDRSVQSQQELRTVISARLPGTASIAEDIFADRSRAVFEVGHRAGSGAVEALLSPIGVTLIKRGEKCLLRFAERDEITLQHAQCTLARSR